MAAIPPLSPDRLYRACDTGHFTFTVLRLRDKGLPRFRGTGKGDLHLQIKVQGPEKVSREERELCGRLRTLAGKTQRRFWE